MGVEEEGTQGRSGLYRGQKKELIVLRDLEECGVSSKRGRAARAHAGMHARINGARPRTHNTLPRTHGRMVTSDGGEESGYLLV